MIEDRTGIGGLIKEKIARFRRIFVHKLNAKEITVGTVKERVPDTGVLVDSVQLKDGEVDGVDVAAHDVATTGVHGAGAATLLHSASTTSALTTVGTIGTGTWQGDVIDHERGGIEADISAITTGGLLVGTGAGAMGVLAVGAANSVLWSNGTTASWSAAPRLANIADVAGTTRITTSAASPHVHIDETMRVDQALGIMSNPNINYAEVLTVSPILPAILTPPVVAVLKVNPILSTTQGFGIYYALEGILSVVSQGSGQTIYEYGLSYVVVATNSTANVNTWAEFMGLNMQLSMSAGVSATLNVTLAASGRLATPTFVGTTPANINVATMHGLMVLNHGHPRVANSYAIRIYDQTNSSVAAYGIYVEDADTYALWMDAGLSRFDGDGTHVFELPVNAVDPTGGGGAATGRIPCTIGGATRHLAYY